MVALGDLNLDVRCRSSTREYPSWSVQIHFAVCTIGSALENCLDGVGSFFHQVMGHKLCPWIVTALSSLSWDLEV